MNQLTPLDLIIYASVSFIMTVTLIIFVSTIIARDKTYTEIMECMGPDRSEEAYHACYNASQVLSSVHATQDK